GELELPRKLAATLDRQIELREPDDRIAELLWTEVAGLLIQLLNVKAVPLQALGGRCRRHPLGGESLAVANPSDVRDEQAGNAQEHIARRVTRALEHSLARSECGRDIAAAPSIGQVERRRLRTRGDELRHFALPDPLTVGPSRQLVDLGRELVCVVSDKLDDRAGGVGIDEHSALAKLRLDPLREIGLAAALG